MKRIIVLLILILASPLTALTTPYPPATTSTGKTTNHILEIEYVRVNVNGVWWVYVYDNGILVDMYVDEER